MGPAAWPSRWRGAHPVRLGPDLYKLSGHGWQVSLVDRGHSFSLVGFETSTQGVALGTNGYLWMTRNGGTSWSRVTV